jgi:hypothetical protein
MNHHQAEARAEGFWRRAGRTEPYPRSLEATVSWALPLAIVKLPRLWLTEIHRWLAEREIDFECQGANRPLRACLLARAGSGLVFVDGSDADDERRLSLAHEVSHFLCDYLDPRRRALEALGEGILGVLDGDRAPSIAEQVDGLLRGVALGTFQHLMERSASGAVTQMAALESEDRADRLALELLAPRRMVLRRLEHRGIEWGRVTAFTLAHEVLADEFGLPAPAAKTYGRMLVMGCRGARSFDEWLHA